MGESTGLLGVGDGVTQPEWVGAAGETQTRDSRILKTSTAELVHQITQYSQAVNLGSMVVGVQTVDVAVTTIGVVEADDYVVFLGAAGLPTHIDITTNPAPSNDVIRLRVDNTSGAAIDPASTTFYFLIVKTVAT